MYGSAIWNHWLERRYGAETIRRAWEVSAVAGGGFAPGAYDAAIVDGGGGRASQREFAEFAGGHRRVGRDQQRDPSRAPRSPTDVARMNGAGTTIDLTRQQRSFRARPHRVRAVRRRRADCEHHAAPDR